MVSRSKLARLNRSYNIIVKMDKLKNANVFNIKNLRARHLLGVAMAYVPSIFNSLATLFIPCIIGSFCAQIGYAFDPKDMASIAQSRNNFSNIIEE